MSWYHRAAARAVGAPAATGTTASGGYVDDGTWVGRDLEGVVQCTLACKLAFSAPGNHIAAPAHRRADVVDALPQCHGHGAYGRPL